jgi:RNA polymerase-binding transcription factor DksA
MMDLAGIEAELQRDRAASLAQLVISRRDLDEVFAAGADVATDDEHDPEGATIAYERSRLQASIDQTETHLSEITFALERLDSGRYGTCATCGGLIAPDRLRARPVVRTCIACASR